MKDLKQLKWIMREWTYAGEDLPWVVATTLVMTVQLAFLICLGIQFVTWDWDLRLARGAFGAVLLLLVWFFVSFTRKEQE